jgi:hypothetical protein
MKAVFVVLFALLVALRPAHGRYYDNRNYGIHVELPGDKSVCLTDPPGSNHGLIVLLHSSDCSHPVKAARIEIYVGSNVPFEAETTAELAKHLCAGRADEPTHLMLDRLKLRRCHMKSDGELEHADYFALRPIRGSWVGEWTVFQISLYCDKNNSEEYSTYLRKLLSGIRLTRQW